MREEDANFGYTQYKGYTEIIDSMAFGEAGFWINTPRTYFKAERDS